MQDLTRRVKWISGIGLEVGLGVFLVTMLFYAWQAPSSEAKAMKKPAAPEGLALTQALPIPATLCIQDDSSHAFLTFEPATGVFFFTNCNGITASGVGLVKMKGNTFTLNFAKGDLRVYAAEDISVRRGNATVSFSNPVRQFSLADRNTANDTCVCAVAMDRKQ